MYNLEIKDNYLYITNTETGKVTDRKISEVEIVKHTSSGTEYTVRYRGVIIDNIRDIPFNLFQLDGVTFTEQQDFEDWKNANTAIIGGGGEDNGGGSPTEPIDLINTSLFVQSDGNIPSGAKTFSVVFRGNGGTLNGSPRPNGYSKEFPYIPNSVYQQNDYTVPTSGGGGATSRGIYIEITT